MNPLCGRLAFRVLVGLLASSVSPVRLRLTRRVLLRPLVVSVGPLCPRLRHRDSFGRSCAYVAGRGVVQPFLAVSVVVTLG